MTSLAGAVAALREGRAFADLSEWRKISVRGADAASWLNDLVTAELSGLVPWRSRPSLLLGPTGRIRAAFTVVATDDGFLLIQDPRQAAALEELLAPYVLSSDVRIEDVTGRTSLVAMPGRDVPAGPGGPAWAPSCLGPGVDLAGPDRHDLIRGAAGAIEAGPEALEAWRIQDGVARFGVDLGTDSLPHEAEFGAAIAYHKGCFMGQEAVAKVRNLGHPPFVVLAAAAPEAVAAGEPILAARDEVGTVTSAAPEADGGSAVIVRVRWAAREGPLGTAGGSPLEIEGPAAGTR